MSFSNEILIDAPVSGVAVPMGQVPDPAFAQNLVGVGVAIDPTSKDVLSPVDGKVAQLHPSRHAVAVTSPEGLEILIHVGLDTVKLRGEGFEALVKVGDRVKRGQTLLRFDADLIARKAKSLLTEVVIANPDLLESWEPAIEDRGTANLMAIAGERLLRARVRGAGAQDKSAGDEILSDAISIENATGLHARPAAVLSATAKKFRSEISVRKGDRSANLRSLVSIMGLEIAQGDQIRFAASGPDAAEAIRALSDAVAQGLGEGAEHAPAPSNQAEKAATPAPVQARGTDSHGFIGVTASPGIAAGRIFQLRAMDVKIEERGKSPAIERERLDVALREAKLQLELLTRSLQGGSDPGKALIFSAHQELLDDPSVLDLAHSEISKGKSAEFGWKVAFTTISKRLEKLNNQLLAARANDARDVGQRVLRLLVGENAAQTDSSRFPERCILVAEDLTPSDVATIDPNRVRGLVTTTGGATSHVAILARSLDIPSLVGTDPRVLNIADGIEALIDADQGELRLNPSAAELEKLESTKVVLEKKRTQELKNAADPAKTTDGTRVHVAANLKGESEADGASKLGAEGVGLLRTEFLFMNRESAPTENEQLAAYLTIVRAFGPGNPVIIRTLDVGGDKPLRYLPIPKEDNPFLGERGLRVQLARPEMFREQLRAILKASAEPGADVKVMFPMVTTVQELRQAKEILEDERKKLGVKPISIGIMVEVPSAALLAEHFAAECDYFSVGSNDLTQYALAIDRGHPKLAAMADGLDPSVLRLIDLTVKGAKKHGKWVGVCGGIASDPQAVPILLGLGVEELSTSIPAVPSIKAQIRGLSMKDCRTFAARALEAESAAEVRRMAKEFAR